MDRNARILISVKACTGYFKAEVPDLIEATALTAEAAVMKVRKELDLCYPNNEIELQIILT